MLRTRAPLAVAAVYWLAYSVSVLPAFVDGLAAGDRTTVYVAFPLLTLLGVVLTVRAVFVGVRVDAEGVTVVQWLTSTRIPFNQVPRLEVAHYSGWLNKFGHSRTFFMLVRTRGDLVADEFAAISGRKTTVEAVLEAIRVAAAEPRSPR